MKAAYNIESNGRKYFWLGFKFFLPLYKGDSYIVQVGLLFWAFNIEVWP